MRGLTRDGAVETLVSRDTLFLTDRVNHNKMTIHNIGCCQCGLRISRQEKGSNTKLQPDDTFLYVYYSSPSRETSNKKITGSHRGVNSRAWS